MLRVKDIKAMEILDSRGNPTVEVTVFAGNVTGTASVPSGASTGDNEAYELRDGGKRYLGLGVQKAIKNIHTKILPLLKGFDCFRQRELDALMIKLDHSKTKSNLGANAMLAVSLACARAGAIARRQELFRYLSTLGKFDKLKLPKLYCNVMNGGKHADNKLSFQEFMIVPRFSSYHKNLRVATEIYHILKKDLHKKYGKGASNVGDEGGFAPINIKKTREALDMLQRAVKDAGYAGKVDLALDCAASEVYKRGKYLVDGKYLRTGQLEEYYLSLIKKYPIVSLEDPFEQENFAAFASLRKKSKIQIVGDDLTVTNIGRIEMAIKARSCNCLLLKMNQIGTLTEALDAAKLAYSAGWDVMVSHRSGETEDTFIADLSVAIGCGKLKSGAPCRGERTAKYNRLLRIEGLNNTK